MWSFYHATGNWSVRPFSAVRVWIGEYFVAAHVRFWIPGSPIFTALLQCTWHTLKLSGMIAEHSAVECGRQVRATIKLMSSAGPASRSSRRHVVFTARRYCLLARCMLVSVSHVRVLYQTAAGVTTRSTSWDTHSFWPVECWVRFVHFAYVSANTEPLQCQQKQ